MKFRAVILLGGKTATGIRVPEEVVAGLGSSKRPPVRVTIGGYTYRSTVAPMGGHFMIPLSAEHRTGAGVAAGDEVEATSSLIPCPVRLLCQLTSRTRLNVIWRLSVSSTVFPTVTSEGS